MSVKSLGKQCMKAYKNPCDGFYAHKLGIYHSYCYLLQNVKHLEKAIDNGLCVCNV